ncbi:GIY-YIG nuclease family protein [Bacillus toyonensis]|uniref:GIY-YIG nuclease family protein n=1 Tax=Bacillus toyonensis TaxID=155322 RepID=UPI002E22FB0A|nr:GIY-YIG nuclease family protein [Bacillus toyonensis]
MKKRRSKTVQIYFPDGDPKGIKIAEVINRTVQATLVPRSLLNELQEIEGSDNVALYFLFGSREDDALLEAYIGEAEKGFTRLKQHDKGKDFWEFAVLITITNAQNQFNKADVKFLENLAYIEAVDAGRYFINQTVPTKSYVAKWREDQLEDIFETISLLLGSLGYPIFDSYRGKEQEEGEVEVAADDEMLYCTRRDADAFGKYTNEGFIVYKGSKLASTSTAGFEKKIELHNKKIENLVKQEVLAEENERYVFIKDYPFSSPSAASGFILQCQSNGWVDWKNKNNQTLDELKRK